MPTTKVQIKVDTTDAAAAIEQLLDLVAKIPGVLGASYVPDVIEIEIENWCTATNGRDACVRPEHEGPHLTYDGREWSTQAPALRVVDGG